MYPIHTSFVKTPKRKIHSEGGRCQLTVRVVLEAGVLFARSLWRSSCYFEETQRIATRLSLLPELLANSSNTPCVLHKPRRMLPRLSSPKSGLIWGCRAHHLPQVYYLHHPCSSTLTSYPVQRARRESPQAHSQGIPSWTIIYQGSPTRAADISQVTFVGSDLGCCRRCAKPS
jgi:hypothetical protein